MDSWGTIIAAASTSPLGILALLILVVSLLATQLLKDATPRTKVGIFLLIFAAVVGYGFTVINTGQSKSTTSVVPDLATAAETQTAQAAPPPTAPAPAEPARPIVVAPPGGVNLTAAGVRDSCNLIPDSSTRRVTADDLASLSAQELKIARNEIYARRGYAFKTRDMQDHFAGCSWYSATAAQVSLGRLERANVDTIRQAEAGR